MKQTNNRSNEDNHSHNWQYTDVVSLIKWPSSDFVMRFVCNCGKVKWVKGEGEWNYYEK
jgi:hypothetical protein